MIVVLYFAVLVQLNMVSGCSHPDCDGSTFGRITPSPPKTMVTSLASLERRVSTLFAAINNKIDVQTREIAELKAVVTQTRTRYLESFAKQQTTLDKHTGKLNNLTQCSCKTDRVFALEHPDGLYKFTFTDAKAACKAQGAQIAAPEHLEEAWRMGFERCRCGWLSDGSVRYPMHYSPGPHCGGYEPGIRNCVGKKLADAYCIRY